MAIKNFQNKNNKETSLNPYMVFQTWNLESQKKKRKKESNFIVIKLMSVEIHETSILLL